MIYACLGVHDFQRSLVLLAAFRASLYGAPPRSASLNNVIADLNFRSSGEPKISCADLPVTLSTASVHSLSRAQQGMGEIGPRLVHRADRISLRRRAVPEAGSLREYEPHPVAPLVAGLQLGECGGVDGLLRDDEALQVKAIARVLHHAI
jgi:hypothetical protein